MIVNKQRRVRILIYLIGSIGDTIVSIPALSAIRRHFGQNAELVVLHDSCGSKRNTAVDVLLNTPEIDRFIAYSSSRYLFKKMLSAVILLSRLRFSKFQAVVYLMPSERTQLQVKRDSWFFKCCGIYRQIGFKSFSKQVLYPKESNGHPGRVMHEALYKLERLRMCGIDISCDDDFSRPFLRIPKHYL
jgi:ADP-heptose:LPS heptosyltransferase